MSVHVGPLMACFVPVYHGGNDANGLDLELGSRPCQMVQH